MGWAAGCLGTYRGLYVLTESVRRSRMGVRKLQRGVNGSTPAPADIGESKRERGRGGERGAENTENTVGKNSRRRWCGARQEMTAGG